MLFYCKLTKALLSYGFELNPYDPCVANKMLNGEQLAICWLWTTSSPPHQVPHKTSRELSEQGKVFKDILQRIILTARFEDATPPKCEIIHMWIDGLNKAVTYVAFDRHEYPRFN